MPRQRRKPRRKATIKAPQALLDIIIPVHGMPEYTFKCLNMIPDAIGTSILYNVYIFDNGSSDEDKTYITHAKSLFGQRFIVLESPENIGFPRACNEAAAVGRSPLIFFLNNDVFLEPGSIDKLVRVMDEPEVGVVGMKLVFPKDGKDPVGRPPGKLQHIGLSTNIRGTFFHNFIGWSPDHPKVNAVKESYSVTGAALMTRRTLWQKVGGFFEGYGLGTYEDVDYCLSVRKLGYKVRVEPEASGEHVTGGTAIEKQIGYPMAVNNLTLMQRWGAEIEYTEWEIW
jgi:GT2 family glycosyltransferase